MSPVCKQQKQQKHWLPPVKGYHLNYIVTTFFSPEHLLVAVPVAVVAATGGFLVSHYLKGRGCKKSQVNTCISKDSPKVVHSFDMEDIGTKAVYCRCWKSKKVSLLFEFLPVSKVW